MQVHVDPNDRDFPTISVPEKKSRFGSRQVPQYVKQGFPNILSGPPAAETFGRTGPSGTSSSSMFPKIPGADENYGMLHNVPETAAEKAMHEMWMARRRQEVLTLHILLAPLPIPCIYTRIQQYDAFNL